jgi:hypothetical protein
MPGASDPNAILNVANQQGAQMVAIGAANDAARLRQQQAAATKATDFNQRFFGQPAQPVTSATGSATAFGNPGASASSATSNSCPSVASTQQPPAHKDAGWGPWAFLANTGVAVSVTHVDSKTLTWEFFNGRPDKITTLNFTYSYVDADTGQNVTKSDTVPLPLKPGDGLGGWTAYTANTRGTINIAVTQMNCQ